MLLGRPAPSVKVISVSFQSYIELIPNVRGKDVRKLHHNVSFVRYFGSNAFSLKHQTPVTILTITQQKSSLHKRRHDLSVNRFLIHINCLGKCHYQTKQFWSLLCEELLSVSLEVSIPLNFLD